MSSFTVPIRIEVDTTQSQAAIVAMTNVAQDGISNEALCAGVKDAMYVYLGAMRRRYSAAEFSPPTPWPDLAEATKYNRLRGAFVRTKGVTKGDRLKSLSGIQIPILYDSGNLYTSLVPGATGYFEFFTNDAFTAGSSVFYARYHQAGGGKLPRRTIFVQPDTETLTSMTQSIASGLQTAFNEAIGTNASSSI